MIDSLKWFGDCMGIKTSLINCSSSGSDAIFDILGMVLNIATFGVGAAAVIGILITGYQFMTARENSAVIVKAKNRVVQIVIGLAIWAVIWGIMQFLLPGGLLGDGR